MSAHAYVITYDHSRWKNNLESLVGKLKSNGLLVQLVSDQPIDTAGSRTIWLRRLIEQELLGILVTFWASREVPSFMIRLRRVVFSLIFASYNLARFLAKPQKFIRIQKVHHFLTMKHLEAIRMFLKDQSGKALLVFEDDAGTKPNFNQSLAKAIQVCSTNAKPVIVNLCSNFGIPGKKNSEDEILGNLPSSMFGFDTTAAYVLSRSAAEIINDQLEARPKLKFMSTDWSFTIALSRQEVIFLSSDICENLSLLSGYSSLDSPIHKRKPGK